MKKSELVIKLIDATNQAWADGNSTFASQEEFAECMCILCDLYKSAKGDKACCVGCVWKDNNI